MLLRWRRLFTVGIRCTLDEDEDEAWSLGLRLYKF
jgi:hypothetical protein